MFGNHLSLAASGTSIRLIFVVAMVGWLMARCKSRKDRRPVAVVILRQGISVEIKMRLFLPRTCDGKKASVRSISKGEHQQSIRVIIPREHDVYENGCTNVKSYKIFLMALKADTLFEQILQNSTKYHLTALKLGAIISSFIFNYEFLIRMSATDCECINVLSEHLYILFFLHDNGRTV